MWLRVTLKNYRSIEKAEAVLAPFTVVVGQNGSGKTNFVDALVLANEVGFDAEAGLLRRGGFGSIRRWGLGEGEPVEVRVRAAKDRESLATSKSPGYVEQWFSLVPDAGAGWRFLDETFEHVSDNQVTVRLTRTGGQSAERGDSKWKFQAPPPTTSIMLFARQMIPARMVEVHLLRLDPVQMSAPQPPAEAGRLLQSGRNLTSVLRRLRSEDPGGFAFVLAAMKRLIPGLEDLSVEELGGFLVLRFSQRQPLGVAQFSASNMSEGALRALGIIVAAQVVSPSELLVVEEPEVAIHPGAAGLLFEVLKRASQQGSVLVTTHSPDLLDAAQDEEILVCSYRDGLTRIGPLNGR